MRLTDLAIRNLPLLDSGQKRIRDDQLPGFGLTIGTTRKTFFVMYGKERQLKTLGHWPEISLKEARQAARKVLAAPTPSRPSAGHFELLTAYLADCHARLRPSTAQRYGFALARHMEKPDHTTSDPNEIKALKAFYNWCIDRDYRTDNPMHRKRAVFAQRDRVLTDDEVQAIWQYEHPPYSDLVKLLILTGQRRAQFAKFDRAWLRTDVIEFPASIMKSKRAHVLPLTYHAKVLLEGLTTTNSWSKQKTRMDKATGVSDYCLHDFRRYFSSTMARLGAPLHVTEHILDHRASTSGVQAIYMRYSFLPEMRESLLKFEKHLATLTLAQG